nr:signal peptidase II [Frisingicoccus sp.]
MMKYLGLAAALCGGDLLIKDCVKDTLDEKSQKRILGDHVILTKFYNEGAMLGALSEQKELLKGITIFGVGSLAGALMTMGSLKDHRLQKIGLSMMLGGALSNGYERLKWGKVTDYISFNCKKQKLRNVVYNFGDFAIFGGTALLVIGECLNMRK